MLYKVKLRRDLGVPVKVSAEQLDGNIYDFYSDEVMTKEETSLYAGETRMFAGFAQDYPKTAPIWLASGDLIPYDDEQRQKRIEG